MPKSDVPGTEPTSCPHQAGSPEADFASGGLLWQTVNPLRARNYVRFLPRDECPYVAHLGLAALNGGYS